MFHFRHFFLVILYQFLLLVFLTYPIESWSDTSPLDPDSQVPAPAFAEAETVGPFQSKDPTLLDHSFPFQSLYYSSDGLVISITFSKPLRKLNQSPIDLDESPFRVLNFYIEYNPTFWDQLGMTKTSKTLGTNPLLLKSDSVVKGRSLISLIEQPILNKIQNPSGTEFALSINPYLHLPFQSIEVTKDGKIHFIGTQNLLSIQGSTYTTSNFSFKSNKNNFFSLIGIQNGMTLQLDFNTFPSGEIILLTFNLHINNGGKTHQSYNYSDGVKMSPLKDGIVLTFKKQNGQTAILELQRSGSDFRITVDGVVFQRIIITNPSFKSWNSPSIIDMDRIQRVDKNGLFQLPRELLIDPSVPNHKDDVDLPSANKTGIPFEKPSLNFRHLLAQLKEVDPVNFKITLFYISIFLKDLKLKLDSTLSSQTDFIAYLVNQIINEQHAFQNDWMNFMGSNTTTPPNGVSSRSDLILSKNPRKLKETVYYLGRSFFYSIAQKKDPFISEFFKQIFHLSEIMFPQKAPKVESCTTKFGN